MFHARRTIQTLFAVALFLVYAGLADAGQTLRILGGPPGGQWNALGDALARLLTEEGIPAENRSGGGVENLRMVGDGRADIGFTLHSFMGATGDGGDALPQANLNNAVLLANLYPQVLYIIVRKEIADRHQLESLADLLRLHHPIRFATLPEDSASEFLFNMLLKSAYRTDYRTLQSQKWNVEFTSYGEISRRFLAGELDVCAYTAGPGTYLIPALEKQNLAAVLLPVNEDKLNLMTHQFMTMSYVIEAGEYESVDNEVVTLGDYSCLVVRTAMPDEMVNRICEILWKRRDELVKISKDMKLLAPRIAVAGQGQAHPGAIKFWNSIAEK